MSVTTVRQSTRRRGFSADQRGGIAIWFAAALLPISLLVGAATDYRRIEVMRAAMQDSADAAVLAGAKAYLAADTTDPQRLAAAQAAAGSILRGNSGAHPDMLRDLTWSVGHASDGGGELVLTSKAEVPLAFGGLFGKTAMPVEVQSASLVELRLEVALVLDTTGSMSINNRIGRLKTATENLIGQLDAAARQSSRTNPLKIALVPYSNTVRVSSTYQSAPWIDGASSGPGYNEVDPPAPALRDRFTRYPAGWRGCLETRPMPHDVENTAPEPSSPDTLFVPYFNPDGSDPNDGCELSPITPLTRDVEPLKASVRALQIGGYTNIPIGLAWGWHALTPAEGPFGNTNPAEPYGKADLVKAVVLMTDGENNLGAPPNNTYTGVGRLEQKRVGVDAASTFQQRQDALDGRLTALCDNMKARGIIIYTVRVEDGSQDLLRGCASARRDGTRRYWNVTDAQQLPGVFNQIGQELIEVRLSR